jgi:toxin CcdB
VSRFALFDNPDGPGFLLDIQADLFDHFQTRVVVPLLPLAAVPPPIQRLHPIFEIDQGRYVMATPLMSAVPARILGVQRGDLSRHHDQIVDAVDMLMQGF